MYLFLIYKEIESIKNTQQIDPMYDYSEQANDTLVYTDLNNLTVTNFEIRTENSTFREPNNTQFKLPVSFPVAPVIQVNQPAEIQFDDFIIANLNKNMNFQPASEFDNFHCFNTEIDISLYD